MATGNDINDKNRSTEVQGGGQSMGVLAEGQLEGNSVTPTGNPGIRHWQATFIDDAGLDERGNIFFAAVEMTRMPMLVTDPNQPDNPIVFANNAFYDLTLYREQDILGHNCRLLQGPETDPATIDEVRQAIREHRAVAVDILNYKADGTPFWNALFIGPIFDKQGKLLHFFASQMDITQRRVYEHSYLQAQKMEAIGQLTAGLAHDFNNLLQVINGNLELAQRLLANPQQAREAIGRAQKAAMKGGALTQQLLTFARKQRLEPRRINLNALVVDFSEMLVRTLGEHVQLHLDLRPGLPPCLLDPTHLEMALLNVLINARDAMPRGGTVTVGTSLLSEPEHRQRLGLPPGRYVVLCVIDEGEGMPPEVLRRATEPFFTTKGPGTGLGLAMVHGFVQQSHGRLELDSETGRGTTVRLIFPVADQREERIGPAGAAPAPQAEQPGKGTVLIVEDNDDVRELGQTMLEANGYRVRAVASGEQALRVLQEDDGIGLLFSDVIMPGGMNGLELAEQVRQRWPQLPILLTTGYMEQLPGKDRDALPVLAKPYNLTNLLDKIAATLNGEALRPHPAVL
ncbi:histidine kinase famiy protein [Pseudoduganella armeniaca]|uniref:histidine kinase n=1 Tax=Pseudoduganella armeniaca TaxID=2072590 RepID=A0A2R4CCT7_9BURK|nr:histidine kinase famiy protein [Pseudoduganella armeniaca]AVR97426.1 hybrid sensor histidine kinase/response regulator [Pseudoduganella armeniaca]